MDVPSRFCGRGTVCTVYGPCRLSARSAHARPDPCADRSLACLGRGHPYLSDRAGDRPDRHLHSGGYRPHPGFSDRARSSRCSRRVCRHPRHQTGNAVSCTQHRSGAAWAGVCWILRCNRMAYVRSASTSKTPKHVPFMSALASLFSAALPPMSKGSPSPFFICAAAKKDAPNRVHLFVSLSGDRAQRKHCDRADHARYQTMTRMGSGFHFRKITSESTKRTTAMPSTSDSACGQNVVHKQGGDQDRQPGPMQSARPPPAAAPAKMPRSRPKSLYFCIYPGQRQHNDARRQYTAQSCHNGPRQAADAGCRQRWLH